jgi:hypothetical protein
MKKLIIGIFLLNASILSADCFKNKGEISPNSMFGDSDQLVLLKKLVKSNPNCPMVGMKWFHDFSKIGGLGKKRNCLVWDSETESLIKFDAHEEGGGVRWQKWNPVTKKDILEATEGEGLSNFEGYTSGKGIVPMRQEVLDYISAQK